MNEMEQISVLPYRKVLTIALRGLRIRLAKTFLVTCCIALAVAFLTYILCSNGMASNISVLASDALQQKLAKQGLLEQFQSADQQSQTAWMLGIALMISFVGIVNSMLISVTERFREIGTMKCLGGLDSFIVKLYLLESLMQGVVGTLVGVLVGIILAYVEGLSRFGGETWGLLPVLTLVKYVVITVCCGIALTTTGALYPAWRAAKMEPIDAIRSVV